MYVLHTYKINLTQGILSGVFQQTQMLKSCALACDFFVCFLFGLNVMEYREKKEKPEQIRTKK